ncbi:hypothetical protein RD792_014332 [Penstemon davidsonii]|uniref:O-fucosyltransferase family protein n=1 Tax=Penstemon davidsonii TaxID=160366 RepID=A0ABR0CP20_9LAMI|nr:hypothetical protein RD792_014332 [Penstemon davidsonii]
MILENRLRLKTSIDAIRWLTFQGCAFRGHDETIDSLNRGNFIELVKLLASYNSNVKNVVLENAPGNAQYISPTIQKDILRIFARKVRAVICKEIGDAKYCIIIDEARDESKREQMAIVLRYVDKKVKFRKGYDGASNMRGEWNGLQALFLNECSSAYYIHCFAHRLQLALVAAAREVHPIHNFLTKLTFIVNLVSASPKRHDQLRDAHTSNVVHLIENGELEIGSGLNQIGTLQRAGDTRWSSHLNSIRSLLKMYDATYSVLESITKDEVKDQSTGYIFFSLSHGPEYHALQIANAVLVARHLGATLALPDIKGNKFGEKRQFGEIYDVNKFLKSLNGIIRVDIDPPTELSNAKLPIVRVPTRVSEDYIASNINPIFQTKKNLKIITYYDSSKFTNGKEDKLSNAYQCLAMYESLKLQPELQELVDSMVGTLRSLSHKTRGRFVAVDFKVEMVEKMGCNGEEIGEFLKKIGFHKDTTVYLTQTGWDHSLNALRNVFPNTFTKDAIMPADEKAKFMDSENHQYEKLIDFYICSQGDVFVPAIPSRFSVGVVGERIAIGKTQILIPSKNTSGFAADYISPYIAKKSHFANSCFC